MNIHMKNHACKDFVESHKKRVWLKTHMSRQNLQVKSKAVKASPKNNKQTNNNQFVNSSCSFSIKKNKKPRYMVLCGFLSLALFQLWPIANFLNRWTNSKHSNWFVLSPKSSIRKYKLFWLLSQLKNSMWHCYLEAMFHGHSTQEPTSNVCDNEQGDPFYSAGWHRNLHQPQLA